MEADEKDPYEILGVPRNATSAKIREAYNEMLRIYGEQEGVFELDDSFGELQEKLGATRTDLKEAFKILSDEDARSNYDSACAEHFPRGGPRAENYVFGSVGRTTLLDGLLSERVTRGILVRQTSLLDRLIQIFAFLTPLVVAVLLFFGMTQ